MKLARHQFGLSILSTSLFLLVEPSHAATFSISPSTISELYAGSVGLQIGGLTNGETVLVEHFIDSNGNGVIDAGEPLVQSLRLTDGQVSSIGGVRNGNVPGDDDLTANGQISANLNFATGSEFSRASATHLFRVSSPGGHFAPLQQSLTVTQPSYAQHISGTVMSGAGPIPYAMGAVLVQIGNNSQFVSGTVADSSGNFSLAVSNGSYAVVAFMPGYVGSFATGPMVNVSGADVNGANVPLVASALSASGSLTEASGGNPVPGIQFFVTSTNNEYAVFFTDAQGNFNVNLTSGQWKFEESDYSLNLGGYFRSQNKPKVDLGATSVSGLGLTCYRGTSMVYGTLKDDQNQPLAGIQLNCGDSSNLYESGATTSTNGSFFAVVTSGTWYLGPSDGMVLPGGDTLQGVQITLSTGQALQTNLVAHHATAWLVGRATDSNSNPIGNGTMLAFNTNNINASAPLAGDGTFALPVSGGTWTIELENGTASSHNVVAPQITYSVADGVNISNINYVAPISTRTISGWVRNGGGSVVIGVNVMANAQIGGVNYGAGAITDSGGNYSLPVLAGAWNVNVDSQGLSQQGYGAVPPQNVDTSTGNRTANFTVGPPAQGTLIFRHILGVVGEFSNGKTPTVTYPATIKNHRVIYTLTDPNPASTAAVLFTGPPGSGLTNTPADSTIGAVTNGTMVTYLSPIVRNPPVASGGNWTVSYKGIPSYMNVADPQANSRILVPLPTVTIQNGFLTSLRWSYHDQFGNPLGTPSFVSSNRVDLFDQNGNIIDAEFVTAGTSYNYPATNQYAWSQLSGVRINYYDNMTNQYFVTFSASSPTLSDGAFVTGQGFHFTLTGPAGQNFTIQYSTNLSLTTWTTLYVTNSPSSPLLVTDPTPTGASRFYRVLVGP